MADPMCAAEVMAKAEHEESNFDRATYGRWEALPIETRTRLTNKKRVGLRALAEMEPTEEMKIAIRSELHGVLTSKMIRDVWNSMCIAAAADGESS